MDSLRKRYIVRFSTQILSGLVMLASQSLMLRGLGPKSYGDYNFTTQFFTQVTAFLDFGVTTAFFTKLSQRPDDTGLVRFYYSYWVVVAFLQGALLAVTFGSPAFHTLWPGQSFSCVLFGFLWALSNAIWQGTSRITDAYALTVRSEKLKVIMRVVAFLVMVPFFFQNSLNLTIVFWTQIVSFAILSLLLFRVAFPGRALALFVAPGGTAFRRYTKEIINYCAPLLVYGAASLVASLFDNWSLQKFAGSVEQGYFGLYSQLGLICLLFCSAMLPLIHREFSVAYAKQSGVADLYRKCVPPIVAGSAFFAIFISVNAFEIVGLFSGKRYQAGAPVVALGILYTIPQCYSQLTGTLFYANGNTGVFRRLGLISCLLGMPLTLLFVGPKHFHFLGGGALGLVTKLVIVATVIMLVQIELTAVQLKISFWEELKRYVSIIAFLAVAALLSNAVAVRLLEAPLLRLFLSGGLFSSLVLCLVFLFPSQLGIPIKKLRFRFASI